MIATDIDGTMLRSDHSLSDTVRRSLWSAKEAGIHVVPATGRPFTVARDVLQALGLPDYWIFSNGAITYHAQTDEIIRGYWIDRSVVEWLIPSLRLAIPGIEFALEGERNASYEAKFRMVVPGIPDTYEAEQVDDVAEHFPDRIQKILAFQPDMQLDDLFQQVSAATDSRVVASYSGMEFIELSASMVTKASALDELVVQLGIEPAEVAAFGDNHNDIPMLNWAGRAFAMGNASDDAKQAADHVIGANDDDGLAEAIDQIVARQ